jgi:polyhydroxyalkanoate synthesis regulator phasin
LFTEELNAFKIRYGIPSADKWSRETGVSKSTIVRALNGDSKGMGVDTLLMLLKPYNGGSIDELLGRGIYSLEKEEAKKKIENVIEVIENSEELPQEPTQEIKNALEEVHDYIANESTAHEKCVVCATYRENIAELKADKSTKDTWLIKLFGLSFLLLGIVFVLILAVVALSVTLINVLH